MSRWKNALKTDAEIKQIKRQAVIREAGRVFSRSGYHNTSLDDVAKTLNVSKGTLYNYVRDKAEILFECHQQALSLGDQALALALETGQTGREQLELMLIHYVRMLLDEFGACAILTEVDALKPDDRRMIVARRDAFEVELIRIVERGMADGSLRAMPPKLAIYCFMGVLNWIPRWYRPEGEIGPQDIAREVADFLMLGMASLPAEAAPARPAKRTSRQPK